MSLIAVITINAIISIWFHFAGADVNARNTHGDSPLDYAARFGHADVAKLLLDRGANVLSRGTKYNACNNVQLLTALLERGTFPTPARASVNDRTKS
jgi:ankyrin repeat protein